MPRHRISHQSKQGRSWHTRANQAAGEAKPTVKFDGAVVDKANYPRYRRIHFDTILNYGQHVETALKCRKSLSLLKFMAKSVANNANSPCCDILWYSLTLTTTQQCDRQIYLQLDRVKTELMRQTIKDTPTVTMHFVLDLPLTKTKQEVDQIKA